MKIHPDPISVPYVHSYGDGWVRVGDQEFANSLVMDTTGQRFDWGCRRFEDLTEQHFDRLVALGSETVIFGSGRRLRFPPPALARSLIQAQIGLDTMDTHAACRTYNILAAEGRRVALAILIEAG